MEKISMAKKILKNSRSFVRIGPRISRGLYQLAKYVYSTKGVNFEDQIEEILERDVNYQMKQKWFANATQGKEGENFERLKKALSEADGYKPNPDFSQSDFDSNNINENKGEGNE